MLEEFSVQVICPIHTKNDTMDCNNYRGFSLLNMTYKILPKIISKRLKPNTEEILGEYQHAFRRNRYTENTGHKKHP
jgi:hypothetical protein